MGKVIKFDGLVERLEELGKVLPEEVPVTCAKCGQDLTIPVEAYQMLQPGDRVVCEDCMQFKLPEWWETLPMLNVPKAYQSIPEDLKLPDEHCRTWQGKPWVMTFFGIPGSGKTWAATHVFNRLVRARAERLQIRPDSVDAVWASVHEVVPLFFEDGQIAVFESLLDAKLLLLDDYGAHRDTPYARDYLFNLLSRRYNEQLPTIVTSNAESLREMAQAGDERMASRLSTGITIKMPRTDHRLKKGVKK